MLCFSNNIAIRFVSLLVPDRQEPVTEKGSFLYVMKCYVLGIVRLLQISTLWWALVLLMYFLILLLAMLSMY